MLHVCDSRQPGLNSNNNVVLCEVAGSVCEVGGEGNVHSKGAGIWKLCTV